MWRPEVRNTVFCEDMIHICPAAPKRQPRTNQGNDCTEVQLGGLVSFYHSHWQKYGWEVTHRTRDDSKAATSLEKPTPTQVTTQEGYIPRTFCTLCRKLDPLEKFLPHGLVCYQVGEGIEILHIPFVPRKVQNSWAPTSTLSGSVSIPRELLWDTHSAVTFCLICLFVCFLRGSLLLSLVPT